MLRSKLWLQIIPPFAFRCHVFPFSCIPEFTTTRHTACVDKRCNVRIARRLCNTVTIRLTGLTHSLLCKNLPDHWIQRDMDQQDTKSMKPPNILIYTGNNETDSSTKYSELRSLLNYCVNRDAYTIYHLKHEDLHTTPWQDNTVLLVNSCSDASSDTDDVFMQFFLKKANVLSFRSSIESKLVDLGESLTPDTLVKVSYKDWTGVHLMSPRNCLHKDGDRLLSASSEFLCTNDENGENLIALISSEKSKAALVQVYLDLDSLGTACSVTDFALLKESNASRFEILRDLLKTLDIDCSAGAAPQLTPGYLLASKEELKSSFIESFKDKLKDGCLKSKDVVLNFVDCQSVSPSATETELPVITKCSGSKFQYFDPDTYWKHLETSCELGCSGLGHILLYSDVIPTTMKVLDGFMFSAPPNVGVIAIAGRQTSGKGRGGNSWLSPVGCAMFSLHVRINLNSQLGRKITFLQHIVSLAVVQSVCSLPGCEDLPLKLKWPNDIYYGRRMKLGGVIVNSSMMGSVIHAVIGCGFNVSNSNPIICINDIIQNYNAEHGKSVPACSVEQLIARTVTKTEQLVNLFQSRGADAFCQLYYTHWIHGGGKVRVESLAFSEVTITGLDDFGFLQVQLDNGTSCSVQPDGNSFDIMHNLIAIKKSQ